MVIGIALFAVPTIGDMYWVTFFPAVLVMGFGMAINMAPMTTVVMGSVEQRHVGIASAINNAIARIGGLLVIAALSIVVISAYNNSLDTQLAHLPLSPVVRHMIQPVEKFPISCAKRARGRGIHRGLSVIQDQQESRVILLNYLASDLQPRLRSFLHQSSPWLHERPHLSAHLRLFDL